MADLRWLVALRSMVIGLGHFFAASPHSRHHQLQALRSLDDRLLKDVGLNRGARAERIVRETDLSPNRPILD